MSGHLPGIHPPRHQLPYTAQPAYDTSSAPSTISPQTPSSAGPPGMALMNPQMVNRPDIDTRHHYPPPLQVSPLETAARYGREFEPMAVQHSIPDAFTANRGLAGSPTTHQPPLPGGPLQAHKRAYRQRRKDPSCDACRERKVKCDATETSSCSECSSRNVKCQFTKETNRRMSSIKQVQDLEKQLLLARQQVSQLRSIVKNDTLAVDDDDPASGQGPSKRRKLTNASNVHSIQRNMESCGKGLIKPPSTKEQSDTQPMLDSSVPTLPSKELGQHLLESYHKMLHSAFPFLNWSSVQKHFDVLYGGADIENVSADASAVLFGVFACGAMRENDASEGKVYFEGARMLTHFWTEKPSLDLIRAALLSLVYLVETNHRTTAFSLMGWVVRAAQDIGLHHKTSTRSTEEEELRYKLWWSIFCMERYLSFEVGRPTMINDEDCEPPEEKPPTPSTSHPGMVNQFDFMVKVARTIPHIQKAFKTPVIPSGILSAIDEQINNCMSTFPSHQQPQSNEYLDPGPSSPVVYLQNARLLLHRHNLSPASPPDAKGVAIDKCMTIAQNTARMFQRSMREPPDTSHSPSKWEDTLRHASSAFLCLHFWRCTMFLAGSGDFEGALILTQSSAAIGKHRPINSTCGRYIEFFLGVVEEKFRQGRVHFGEDDELLTYVSADLQSNLDQAWIWQVGGRNSPVSSEDNIHSGILHSEDSRDWDDWDGIIKTLQRLVEEQKKRHQHQQQQHPYPPSHSLQATQAPPPPPPLQHHHQQQPSPPKEGPTGPYLAPRVDAAASPSASVSPGGSSNRMSIADLI